MAYDIVEERERDVATAGRDSSTTSNKDCDYSTSTRRLPHQPSESTTGKSKIRKKQNTQNEHRKTTEAYNSRNSHTCSPFIFKNEGKRGKLKERKREKKKREAKRVRD